MGNKREAFCEIPAGSYKAKIIDCKETNAVSLSGGLSASVLITFELGKQTLLQVPMVVYQELLDKTVYATLGEGVNEINLAELIGRDCGIEIEYVTTIEESYPTVIDVFPLSECN
ncbi:hypothetical protein ACFVHQ_13445 [Actinomycetes bacterium NPDC127524]